MVLFVVPTTPTDDVDWYSLSIIDGTNFELPDSANNYEITLVPTFCTGNKTLVHYEGYLPIIYYVQTGCEYRILYANRCETSSGEITPSEYVEFSETFCTGIKLRKKILMLELMLELNARLKDIKSHNLMHQQI